ncbi:MAG: hypothetical protein ACKVOE_03750 [Rickettsiales bacterium]
MQPMRTGGHSAATDRINEKIKRIDVLIVISSSRAADLIRSLFAQLGFQNIHMANDAIEAVALMRQLRMHLIIADSELRVNPASGDMHPNHPNTIELSGIHFVQRLRQAPNSPSPFVPVLMLMDQGRSREVINARDAGVNDIVLRPMQARDFCQRVIDMIDKPRTFITASTYKGPCRRRKGSPPPGQKDRRVRDVRLIRCNEMKGKTT